MNEALRYLPIDRLHALAAGDELPGNPTGAALFADISGFTALTAALAEQLGPKRGAEELTRYLNRVYEALVAPVRRHRGSVISFAGDAITCWIEDDDGRRAATCALEMQEALAGVDPLRTPGGTESRVKMRVGIATGAARRFVVGDPRHQRVDVLAGKTLDRMALASDLAGEDQVVVIKEVVAALGPGARTHPCHGSEDFAIVDALPDRAAPSPWPELDTSVLSEASVRPWLPAAVYDRLRAAPDPLVAEMRHTSALFIRIGDLDYDDPSVIPLLDAWIRRVQEVLARFEGTMIQITTGDKGSYLYVSFGTLAAHEDDPERAVGAALAIRDASREFPRVGAPRMGVSAGRMYTGAYGSRTRRTFGSIGRETNIAARLMGRAAPGQVMMTEPVARAVAARFEIAELEAIEVKGSDEPIPVFEAIARREESEAPRRTTRDVVGRRPERARLSEAVRELHTRGRGGVLVVEGEGGIGKSHLAANVLAEADGVGVRCYAGAGAAVEQTTAYFGWRGVFAGLFEITSRDGDNASLQELVLARIGANPAWIERAPLLTAVLPGLELVDSDLTREMSGEVRADNTGELLVQLLTGLNAHAPVLVFLDDAHWLDSASWALVSRVARDAPSVLLLIGRRPMEEEPLDAARVTDRLLLDAMPEHDMGRLIAQSLRIEETPPTVHRLVVSRAHGNPFFAQEIAHELLERSLIRIEDGRCEIVGEPEELGAQILPTTAAGVVMSRVDRLSPDQQLTLKVASVIGRTFRLDALVEAHPGDVAREALRAHLGDLERFDITLLEAEEPAVYAFKHAITHEAVYERLLFAQRRDLHARVAAWYEGVVEGRAAFAVLAHHWGEAEVVGKQMRYLELAGDEALRAGAFAEGRGFYRTLLDLDDDAATDREGRWRWRLGQALNGLGDVPRARVELERAIACFGYPFPRSSVLQALGLGWELARQLAHRTWPGRFKGRVDPEHAPSVLAAAKLYRDLIDTYWYLGEKLRHLYCAARLLNASEAVGHGFELAQGYITFAVIAGVGGLPRVAAAYYDRALEVATRLGQDSAIAFVQLGSGIYRTGLGELERAHRDAREAEQIYRRLGDEKRWSDCVQARMGSARQLGRPDETAAAAEELYAHSTRFENSVAEAHALMGRGAAAVDTGRFDEAARQLQRALADMARIREEMGTIACLGMLATARWWQGERDEGIRLADEAAEAIARFRGIPNGFFTIDAYVAATEIPLAVWEQARDAGQEPSPTVRRRVRRGCRALKSFTRTFPIGRPALMRCRGLELAMRGRRAAAERAWRHGLEAAVSIPLPTEQAKLHYEIGRHRSQDDPARRQHLEAACALFARTGRVHELARVQGALGTA